MITRQLYGAYGRKCAVTIGELEEPKETRAMPSPAQRHRQAVELRQLERQEAVTIADGASMHLQARAIERDVKRLREQPTTADRVEMKKRELLLALAPTAERYLSEGVYRNPILLTAIVWLSMLWDF
ncbi:hypothetical protein AB6F62_16595 [Providencia huaxiensis]|uniref:hypothetical protein n=1 Tax=Providencia huaxiensis TaxID=2027290 RepID=UPI0034DCFD6F